MLFFSNDDCPFYDITKKAAREGNLMISKKSCIPHESSIRPECVQKIKQARADISDGTGKTYASIDDFF
jgi:hypothetical protein